MSPSRARRLFLHIWLQVQHVPGAFPATKADADALTHQDLDNLAHFYGAVWPGTVDQRRCAFFRFAGIPGG